MTALLFLLPFGLYLVTLAPSVTFWDSGELITAAGLLGIPHQPGYPLYCLVGRLFSFIPLGGIAYRLNLLSASFSALGVALLYLILREIIRGRALPALLALALGAISAYWSQAVVSEVYALNTSFLAVLILTYVRARKGTLAALRYYALSGLLFGLGIINHMSLVLYLPSLAVTWLVLPVDGGARGRVRAALTGAAFIVLGLSVYMYLPVRSAAGAGLNLGHPDTWPGFLWVIKWGEFIAQGRAEAAAFAALVRKLGHADIRLLLALPAAAYFLWRLIRDDWRLYTPLVLFFFVYTLGISTQALGSARDEAFGLAAKFYIPVFMLLIIFIGGVSRDLAGLVPGRYVELAVAATYGFTAAALVYYNCFPNDYSRNFVAYDYAQNSLKSAGEKGVLFTWGDNGVFPLWYLHKVERYRDDIALVHTPLMTYGWYLDDVDRALGRDVGYMGPYFLGENAYRIFKAVTPERPVAYDYSTTRFLKLDLSRLKARGLVYFEGPGPSGDPWPWYVFRGVDDPTVYKGPMERNIIDIYKFQRRLAGGAASP